MGSQLKRYNAYVWGTFQVWTNNVNAPVLNQSFIGDKDFLSNFYHTAFSYEGVQFSSSEQAYQWSKCKKEEDKKAILRTTSPTIAKRIGKGVELIDNWNNKRIGIMYEIVKAKFSASQILTKKLLATGSEELIEENYWGDRFYGTCDGKGANWLGQILMTVREELRKEMEAIWT